MNVLHNFTCIYHDFDVTVVKQKLGDNIVTVTNNVVDATHQPVDGPCIVPVDKNDTLLHDTIDDEVGIIAADGSNPAVSSPTVVLADVDVCVRSEVDPPTDAEDARSSMIADVRDPTRLMHESAITPP